MSFCCFICSAACFFIAAMSNGLLFFVAIFFAPIAVCSFACKYIKLCLFVSLSTEHFIKCVYILEVLLTV